MPHSVAATKRFADASSAATNAWLEAMPKAASPLDLWRDASAYWLDFAQRSVLFADTLRRRGNNWLEHEKAGKPPLLDFEWEIVADASVDEPAFRREALPALATHLDWLARERDPELGALEPRAIASPQDAEAICDRIAATGALDEARAVALEHVAAAKAVVPDGLAERERRALLLVADGVVARYS